MTRIIYPITWLSGHEGEAADVIHEIALEMMEHRDDLFENITDVSDGKSEVYLKQANLFEEYATVLDAIYFQMQPEKWDPNLSAKMLELARVYQISLPGWMTPGLVKPDEVKLDTTGRNWKKPGKSPEMKD